MILTLAAILAVPVVAQVPGAPAAVPAARGDAQPAQTDAPARVGRLARIAGTVSFHPEAADRWEPALLNYPVSDGAAFWTEPGAEADIDIGASRVVMDATTELDIHAIDTLAVQASLPQGTVYLRLRTLAEGETWVIQTPRGAVLLRAAGRYGIFAGDLENATRVTVLEGAARLNLGHTTLDLAAGQSGVIEGVDDFAARAIPAGPEPFLLAQAGRDQAGRDQAGRDRPAPPAPASRAPPPPMPATTTPATTAQQHIAPPAAPGQATALPAPAVVITLPGGAELDPHGSWADAAPYGRVWFPRVAPDWQPFRDGRWVWVRPWGWTWLDDAPWGFTTSHFGRWVKVQGRWAWAPGEAASGETARPVYVPAMVVFQRGAPGPSSRTGPAIGWTPLGWGEAYRPWYRHSPGYLRALNPVPGGPTRGRTTARPGLSHQAATLSVPAEAMTNSSRVGTLARPLPGGPASATGTPPRPSLNTIGMNREEARRLNILLPPPRDMTPIKPPAPGPILFHRLPNPNPSGQTR